MTRMRVTDRVGRNVEHGRTICAVGQRGDTHELAPRVVGVEQLPLKVEHADDVRRLVEDRGQSPATALRLDARRDVDDDGVQQRPVVRLDGAAVHLDLALLARAQVVRAAKHGDATRGDRHGKGPGLLGCGVAEHRTVLAHQFRGLIAIELERRGIQPLDDSSLRVQDHLHRAVVLEQLAVAVLTRAESAPRHEPRLHVVTGLSREQLLDQLGDARPLVGRHDVGEAYAAREVVAGIFEGGLPRVIGELHASVQRNTLHQERGAKQNARQVGMAGASGLVIRAVLAGRPGTGCATSRPMDIPRRNPAARAKVPDTHGLVVTLLGLRQPHLP